MQLAFVGGLPLLAFLVVLVLSMELGRWLRMRQLRGKPNAEGASFGAVDGAVFGLMGLILGFSFAGAASRFDGRRALIVQEVNSIGTAWLRLDVLPEAARAPLQARFRTYVDARIAAYRALGDAGTAQAAFTRARGMQGEIWSEAMAAAVAMPTPSGTMFLMPAINTMFDDGSTRDAALMAHLPVPIFALLIFLVLCCGVLAGYGLTTGGPRSWIHIIGFSVVITIMLYVITDYEYPRMGRITVAAYDRLMVDLRQQMQ
jgi:hypothetical protein